MGKKEFIIVIVICLLFLTLSLISNLRQYVEKPANTVYTFLHNSISDYPYYISFIRQGTDGRFTTVDRFTTEPQTSGFIHIFYLLLGQGGRVIGLSPVQIYFISRILLGLVFLTVSYKFISQFFQKYWERIITLCIFLTAASFPKEFHFEGGFSAWSYLYWWTEMDPLNRVSFIPHFLFGHINFILILFLFLKKKNIFILAFWGLITGFVHPPSLGMTYYILASLLILKGIKNIIKKDNRWKSYFYEVYKFIIYFSVSVPSLVYIYYITTRIFPWTLMGMQESLFYAVSLKDYLLSIGPILPLAVIGSVIYLSDRNKVNSDRYAILFLWVIIDFVMIPLSELIHYSAFRNLLPTFANIRFLSMVVHLPLSILSGFLLIKIYRKNSVFFMIATFFYLIMTMPMLYSSIKGQMVDNPSINQYVYVNNNTVEAITDINNQLKDEETVLANEYISQLLPIFSKSNVYFGQAVYTKDNIIKREQVNNIYSGKEDACLVYQMIKANKLNYLFISNQTEIDTFRKYKYINLIKKYPLVEKSYPVVFGMVLDQKYQDFCNEVNKQSI